MWLVGLAPLVIVGGMALVLAVPATREAGIWLLLEDHPVEIATFGFLVAAGLASLYQAWSSWRRREGRLTPIFFLAFGAGLILTGMEEIAWGQYWLGFETPAALADLNVKGEATLHNISGLDGRTEILRVAFGIGGLIGIWLNHVGRLPAITPPTVLWTWFAVIAIIAAYDFVNDITALVGAFDTVVEWIDELVELLIGVAALLFVMMKIQQSRYELGASSRRS
jgi:hypothetical protein